MSQTSKTPRPSGLPIRVSQKGPVMSSPIRGRTGCLVDAENNNPYPRGQTGLPRNRLGNKPSSRVLSDLRQNQISAAALISPKNKSLENGISRSAPDIPRALNNPRLMPDRILPGSASKGRVPKTQSVESIARLEKDKNMPKAKSIEKVNVLTVNRPISKATVRVSSATNLAKKSKTAEGPQRTNLAKNRVQKPVENKRKFGCLDNVQGPQKSKIPATELLSPNSFKFAPPPPKNLMEDCEKIVKKILFDKKMSDLGESKRSSSEFDESIGTFNSDEMMDFFASDLQRKRLEPKPANELDKSSKRNSSEFEDSIGSFFSDQMVLTLSKSNEFLNLAELKQGLCYENHLGLSISEDIDNLTPGFSDLSNAIDHTPSVEDLPMECEIEPESGNSTTPGVEPNISARSPSPNEELPLESLSSRTPNAPVSIITSITSIMSLDTGYQGDGELSRPESRNAETEMRLLRLPNSENGLHVKTINFDDGKTMTDSDFFTESDADVHDDLSAAAAEIGSGKGDRKAQVIDGTLYGGVAIQNHSFANPENDANGNADKVPNRLAIMSNGSNEDMESSGIYSDFEKKPDEPAAEEPVVGKAEPVSYLSMITEQMKTIQNLALSLTEAKFKQEELNEGMVKSSSGESSSTVQEVPSSVKVSPSTSTKNVEAIPAERKEPVVRKNKMPNRNVTSKIKALIETPKPEQEVAKPKTVKKGKWDAVMDKIAQGKEENKYTPSKFRDIKSKVFQNVAPLFTPRKMDGPAVDNSPRGSVSSAPKARSRRSTRVRSSESSLVSPKTKQSRKSNSPNSSQRSSLSDISVSTASHLNAAPRVAKKRDSCSPQSNASTNSGNTPIKQVNSTEQTPLNRKSSFRNSDLQNGNVVRNTPSTPAITAMKTPPVRKAPTPRRNETVIASAQKAARDSNQNGVVTKSASATTMVAVNNNNNNTKVKSLQAAHNRSPRTGTRASGQGQVRNANSLAAAKETTAALLKQVKHNSRAFESLAVLLNYCTNDLDAFSTPQLKQTIEKEKSRYIEAKLEIEELEASIRRLQDELFDKEHLVTDLKNDNTSLSEECDQLKRLVDNLKASEMGIKVKLGIVEDELIVASEQKSQAEGELLRECENFVRLKRELSERIDRLENDKESLATRLSDISKENDVLKSANREIKEEYDKCLKENQRLINVCSKMKNDVLSADRRVASDSSENVKVQLQNGDIRKERSPEKLAPTTPDKAKCLLSSSMMMSPDRLESEVESLRQVLILKTDEVTDLRRQELQLRENADRVPKLLSTITMLEGKVEDLQTQLSSHTETVRDLQKHNDHVEEELKTSNNQKLTLTHKNEVLQYKLRQYAEAMRHLANQKNLSEYNIKAEFSPIKTNHRRDDDNLDDSVRSEMKGVVEKSDSVSYMLEMTEDTNEIVTNILRRVDSIRSSTRSQTLPKKKRAKTLSICSTETVSKRLERASSIDDDFRPHTSSTPTSTPPEFDYESTINLQDGGSRTPPSPMQYPINKIVKLNQNDFATDSIELPHDNDCEIIEITKNFDKTDKNTEMVTSTSSSSSSSSNGSNFDIESDIYSNLDTDQAVQEIDENTENSEIQDNCSIIRTFRREAENIKPVLPIYKDIEANDGHSNVEVEENDVTNTFLSSSKSFIKIPKISGGEAMIGLSSDDEDVDKMK